jgi:hypothetical protein
MEKHKFPKKLIPEHRISTQQQWNCWTLSVLLLHVKLEPEIVQSMKNKIPLKTTFIISNAGLLALFIIGLKTVSKYSSPLRDWHYNIAIIGSILVGLMILFSLVFAFKPAKKDLS